MEERGEIHIEADCFCADLCQKGALKRQRTWQELFQYLDDPLDQSRFLMQLGLEKPSISELHRKECRIEGCKTNIWREIYLKEGRIVFRADSDSLVIQGALSILTDIFHTAMIDETAALTLSPLDIVDPVVLNPDIVKGGLSVLLNEVKNLKGEE